MSSESVSLADEAAAKATWARLRSQIDWYDTAANHNQIGFRAAKVAQLVLGAAVPVAATTDAARWLLAALGAGVVIVEGVAQLFQFHRNWISYRATCEALRREEHLCQVHAGVYARADNPVALLAERLELIVGRETSEWGAAEALLAAADGRASQRGDDEQGSGDRTPSPAA